MNVADRATDKELIDLLRQGEMAAFEELYNRYWAKLYSGAYKRVRSRETAEEIVQDFFTGLWINRQTLFIQGSFSAYAYAALRYRVLNHWQRESVRKEYKQAVQPLLRDFDNATEDEVMLHELQSSLQRGVEQLPDKCRSVFELSRMEHKSVKEIATTLGISEKTVENHLTKALRILKLNLKDFVTFVALALIHHT